MIRIMGDGKKEKKGLCRNLAKWILIWIQFITPKLCILILKLLYLVCADVIQVNLCIRNIQIKSKANENKKPTHKQGYIEASPCEDL